MANVESMIVEEKSHIKPIDREKVCSRRPVFA